MSRGSQGRDVGCSKEVKSFSCARGVQKKSGTPRMNFGRLLSYMPGQCSEVRGFFSNVVVKVKSDTRIRGVFVFQTKKAARP